MKNIEFKKLSIQNFLSIGKDPVVIEFKSGINVITGLSKDVEDSKNGIGKCVDKKTKIHIQVIDNEAVNDFMDFMNSK